MSIVGMQMMALCMGAFHVPDPDEIFSGVIIVCICSASIAVAGAISVCAIRKVAPRKKDVFEHPAS